MRRISDLLVMWAMREMAGVVPSEFIMKALIADIESVMRQQRKSTR